MPSTSKYKGSRVHIGHGFRSRRASNNILQSPSNMMACQLLISASLAARRMASNS